MAASDGFDAVGWVERLARALTELAQIQQHYRDELYIRNAGRSHRDEYPDPSRTYQRFYHSALETESGFQERRFGPVRPALTKARGILSEHPAWAETLEASDNGQIQFEFPYSAGEKSLLSVIAGLMARGREAGEDGFRVACSELALILEPEGEADPDPVREELLTGYQVVLFQGLMFGEEVRLGDGLAIVPFGRLDAFFDADLLDRLVPGAGKRGAENVTAAIVKPFRWKPAFPADGPPSRFDRFADDPFVEDADVLIELLALFHAAPAVRIASLTPRIHRRTCLLLGSLEHYYSFSGGYRSWMSGWLSGPVAARRDAIDAAISAFADRNGEGYRHCAPAIARLAEALARRGRFRTDDGILDVAITLERMYRPGDRGVSAQLQRGMADFLGGSEGDKCRIRARVKHFYDVRSAIIHGPRDEKKRKLLEERPEAFRDGFEMAQRTVVKMLNERPAD
ncbi:MAG: hypothetical protein OXC10_00380 [Rhodospirillaceae bacterium]|nr:hypothetical protein [Rhodospirillaceae bacterium]